MQAISRLVELTRFESEHVPEDQVSRPLLKGQVVVRPIVKHVAFPHPARRSASGLEVQVTAASLNTSRSFKASSVLLEVIWPGDSLGQ